MPRDRFTKPSLLLAAVLAAVAVLAPSLRAQNAAHDADYSYTPRERMADYLKRTVGPGGLFNAAFLGGMDQWRDKPEGWEQGGAGYGKRFASRLGRGAMVTRLWPMAGSAARPTIRAMVSGLPPAVVATTRRMGRAGQGWADTTPTKKSIATTRLRCHM